MVLVLLPMADVTNLSAYKFTPLDELPAWRERLLRSARARGLKGTILLSHEGINLFVAGTSEHVNAFVAELRALRGLKDLVPKLSPGTAQPFGRLLVKIKPEIIAFGVEGIDPARRPARALAPETLRQWLDDGRPVTLLDTRNDYEVKLGTFRGAVPAGIRRFRDFPAAVDRLPGEWKSPDRPIVAFCTGGIRCEKAAPYLERAGFGDVWQLEGGILKYFERCGGAHFDGECFVFDQRVGVDQRLQETGAVLCACCQQPVTALEQSDPRYVVGRSCPGCFARVGNLVTPTPATTEAS